MRLREGSVFDGPTVPAGTGRLPVAGTVLSYELVRILFAIAKDCGLGEWLGGGCTLVFRFPG